MKLKVIGIFVALKVAEIAAILLILGIIWFTPTYIGRSFNHLAFQDFCTNYDSTHDDSCDINFQYYMGGLEVLIFGLFCIVVTSAILYGIWSVLKKWFSANWKWSKQIEKRLRRK